MEKVISFLLELQLDAKVIHQVADKLLSEEKLSQEEVEQLKSAFVVEEQDEEKQFEEMKAHLDNKLGIKRD